MTVERFLQNARTKSGSLDATCRSRLAFACWLMPLLLAGASAAQAQQWFFSPEIGIGVQYVDNPRLEETGDTDSITGGVVNIGAAFHRNTQTSSMVIRPSIELERYSSGRNEDSDAYFLDFDGEKEGQRSNWRLRGNFRRQQVLRGETTSPEIDDIGVDDDLQTGTGQTFFRRERDMLRLSPGFTFDFTERTSVSANVNFLGVRYDTEAVGEAVDYTNVRADTAIGRALTPDSSVEFGVFAATYDPDGISRETESLGARARYEKDVSDISSFFIEVGAQDAEIQSSNDAQNDVSETSFLWNMGYSRQLERTRWRFDLGQQVTPSGSGAIVERDLYRAIMHHQLRPRWTLGLSAVFLNTDALGREDVGGSLIDRDYLRTRATLSYQMTRNWTVEGRYSFTNQDFASIPGDAQEHAVRLWLVYSRPVPTS